MTELHQLRKKSVGVVTSFRGQLDFGEQWSVPIFMYSRTMDQKLPSAKKITVQRNTVTGEQVITKLQFERKYRLVQEAATVAPPSEVTVTPTVPVTAPAPSPAPVYTSLAPTAAAAPAAPIATTTVTEVGPVSPIATTAGIVVGPAAPLATTTPTSVAVAPPTITTATAKAPISVPPMAAPEQPVQPFREPTTTTATVTAAAVPPKPTLGALVVKEELVKTFPYGKSLIPVTQTDEQALFQFEASKGMSVLGFYPRAGVARDLFQANTSTVIAQPNSEHASQAFATMVKAMQELDVCALVRYVRIENAQPRLAVLIPVHKEGKYQSFHFIPVPYADDMHEYTFASLPYEDTETLTKTMRMLAPDTRQLAAAERLIKDQDLMHCVQEEDTGYAIEHGACGWGGEEASLTY